MKSEGNILDYLDVQTAEFRQQLSACSVWSVSEVVLATYQSALPKIAHCSSSGLVAVSNQDRMLIGIALNDA